MPLTRKDSEPVGAVCAVLAQLVREHPVLGPIANQWGYVGQPVWHAYTSEPGRFSWTFSRIRFFHEPGRSRIPWGDAEAHELWIRHEEDGTLFGLIDGPQAAEPEEVPGRDGRH